MTTGQRRRPVVAVIGDARLPEGCERQQIAVELGSALVDHGFRVLTGGLGGVMAAACRGAHHSKHYQEGATIGLLPGHDAADANPDVDIVIPTGLDMGRNSIVAHADAVIAIGGGAGTLSEIAFAWMLKKLVIALRAGGWAEKLADTALDERPRYPGIPNDRVYAAKSATEAVSILELRIRDYNRPHHGIPSGKGKKKTGRAATPQ